MITERILSFIHSSLVVSFFLHIQLTLCYCFRYSSIFLLTYIVLSLFPCLPKTVPLSFPFYFLYVSIYLSFSITLHSLYIFHYAFILTSTSAVQILTHFRLMNIFLIKHLSLLSFSPFISLSFPFTLSPFNSLSLSPYLYIFIYLFLSSLSLSFSVPLYLFHPSFISLFQCFLSLSLSLSL